MLPPAVNAARASSSVLLAKPRATATEARSVGDPVSPGASPARSTSASASS